MIRRASAGLVRVRQLVLRALFELRMADDAARAEGLDGETLELIEMSKRPLRVLVSKTQAPVPEGERVEAA